MGKHGAELGGGFKQFGGLAADDVKIAGLVEIGIVLVASERISITRMLCTPTIIWKERE